MLYVSVGDVVPDNDNISADSQMSALLPSEVTQHLDTYDGSLGCVFIFSHSLTVSFRSTVLSLINSYLITYLLIVVM